MSQDTINFLSALATLLILAWNPIRELSATLYEKLLSHLPDAQHNQIARAVDMAVKSVEQLSNVADESLRIAPQDRKAKAMDAATQILAHFHVKVSPDVLSTYVENAVALLPKSGYTGNGNLNQIPDDSQAVPVENTPPIASAV